jgi:fluoroquinolone resistance protein
MTPCLIFFRIMKKVFDDKIFDKYDIFEGLEHEFNDCFFQNSDFSGALFDGTELVDCTFSNCNLSMAKFENALLNKVKFISCKVMGVDFSKCSKFLFTVSFENCVLNYSIFQKNDLRNTMFKKCTLHEASFLETNLMSAKFVECELDRAIFDHSNLEKADFSTSRNYSFNPTINKMKNATFSMPDAVGLLSHLDINIVG